MNATCDLVFVVGGCHKCDDCRGEPAKQFDSTLGCAFPARVAAPATRSSQ